MRNWTQASNLKCWLEPHGGSMTTTMSAAAITVCFAPVVMAAYSNLIATDDGKSVYFGTQTGYANPTWYVARAGDTGPVVEPLKLSSPLQDVSGSETVFATAFSGARICGVVGSSCFVKAPCSANFSITGPQIDISNFGYPTFARLD